MTRPRHLPMIVAGLLVFVVGLAALRGFEPYRLGVWGDMATHVMQARSLAHDGDLRYTERDIERWFTRDPADQGPRGLYLKRNAGGRYYYAAPFLYSAVAAPFVRVAGDRGLLVLNVGLLGVLVAMLAGWWGRTGNPWLAAVFALVLIGFSYTVAYVFIMQPDLFLATLLGLGLILVFRSVEDARPTAEPSPTADAESGDDPQEVNSPIHLRRLLTGAALLGLTVYGKPILVLFAACALVAVGATRRWKALALAAAVMAASWLAPTTVHLLQDGTVSPYLGDRRQYVRGVYPLTERSEAFKVGRPGDQVLDDGGVRRREPLVPAGGLEQTLAIARHNFPLNVWYFFVGRQTSLVAYFPGILVCLVLLIANRKRRRAPGVLAASAVYVLVYFLLRPNNYFGGGSALGNRNLLHILPALALLAPALPRGRRYAAALAVIVLLGGVFLNPVLRRPRFAVLGRHNRMKLPGLAWLPLELTQIPGMFGSPRESVALTETARLYRLTGTRPSSVLGLIMKSDHMARLVLETHECPSEMHLRLFAGPKGVELTGLWAARKWRASLIPGACRSVVIPVRCDTHFATPDGERWAAEFGFRAAVPDAATPEIAVGIKPPSPSEGFALPVEGLHLGTSGDRRHLLWGWTGPDRSADGETFRGVDERDAFLLVYLPPGQDYILSLEGRSDVPGQQAAVTVNGRDCGTVTLSAAWETVRCTIPRDAPVQDVTTIRLSHAAPSGAEGGGPRTRTADGRERPGAFAAYRRVTVTPKPNASEGQ